MGYAENNYANSNNGGSVNSQDSIWQLKMSAAQAAAAANSSTLMATQHYAERPTPVTATASSSAAAMSYGYDPLTHPAYGTVEDYASYPHLAATPSQHGAEDEYQHTLRQSQNPSRQEFCGDSYASVHKPKKRLDQPHLGECCLMSLLPRKYPRPS